MLCSIGGNARFLGVGSDATYACIYARTVYELAAYPAFAAIKFEFTTRNGLESKTRKKRRRVTRTRQRAWKQWRKDERGRVSRSNGGKGEDPARLVKGDDGYAVLKGGREKERVRRRETGGWMDGSEG